MASMDRDEAIRRIRTALKKRSGKAWSVKGGKGTAYCWLRIDAPPKRRTFHFVDSGKVDAMGFPVYDEIENGTPETASDFGHTGPEERAELGRLLGVNHVHHQGVQVSPDSWEVFVAKAENA